MCHHPARNQILLHLVEDEQDGGGDDNDGGDDSGNDDDGNNDDMNRMVGDRVARLAAALAGGDDDGNKNDNDGDEDDDVIEIDGSPPSATSTDTTENTSNVKKADQLMNSFRTLLQKFPSSNDCGGDYLDHILRASARLANSEHVSGSVSFARKAKSLVERWIARPVGQGGDKASPSPEDILIERDVIVMINVKIGTGAGATTVQRPFRVLDLTRSGTTNGT